MEVAKKDGSNGSFALFKRKDKASDASNPLSFKVIQISDAQNDSVVPPPKYESGDPTLNVQQSLNVPAIQVEASSSPKPRPVSWYNRMNFNLSGTRSVTPDPAPTTSAATKKLEDSQALNSSGPHQRQRKLSPFIKLRRRHSVEAQPASAAASTSSDCLPEGLTVKIKRLELELEKTREEKAARESEQEHISRAVTVDYWK